MPNRIVKSAMAEGRCDSDGRPRPALADLYERWSAGGVGLCITGLCHVRRGYGFTGREIGLYSGDLVAPLKSVTEAVHRHPGKIFAQLCWAPPQIPRASALTFGSTAPSAGFNKTNLLFDRALTDGEIVSIIQDLAAAAGRARSAGFDGIQLHGAHGYLISRMLSPKHNRRSDRWGGSFDGRLCFLREIIAKTRSEIGQDFPLTIKLNVHDGEPDGLDLETGVRIAKAIAAMGIDAIEVSAGTGDVGLGCYPNRGGLPAESGKRFLLENFPALKLASALIGPALRVAARTVAFPGEAYFEPLARRVAEAVSVPVICVGGIRTMKTAERILATSRVAMVSLARPLVREPDLPRAWQSGARTGSSCTSCNECFSHIGLGEPLACYAIRAAPPS